MHEVTQSTGSFRILHIITGTSIGGAEQTLKKLLLEYPDTMECLVVSLTSIGPVGHDLEKRGHRIEPLNITGPISAIAGYFKLRKILKEFNPDIVQTWMYHADLFGGLCAYYSGYKNIIWGVRRTGFNEKNKTYFLMKICAFLSRLIPKRVICVSCSAKEMHEKYGYDKRKSIVIHNGIDCEIFKFSSENRQRVRDELNISDSDLIVGVVGRFHFDKGQDIFIDAAATVFASGHPVRFLLVGRGCSSSNKVLMDQIVALGLQNNVILMGEREDIPDILSAMDIYCMTSRTEGFPNGLVEAMATEVPCIATNVGETEQIAAHGMNLVSPIDSVKVALAINEMLDRSVAARLSVGKEERKKVEKMFSISKMRNRFFCIYAEILDDKKKNPMV